MIKTAKLILTVVVIVLAVYGAMKLIYCYLLGPSQGEKAVEAVHPFVSGAVSAAGGKLRDSFMNIPDSQLESEGELLGKKLYPATKGILKGEIEAFSKDPDRKEITKKIFGFGKDLSRDLLTPLGEKIDDSTRNVLQDWGKTLEGVRKFREENKDLLNGLSAGLEALQKKFREAPLPAPPLHREH